jgi:Methyltransferase domain
VPEQDSSAPAGRSFDDVWTLAESVPGWLTKDQARRLWDEAAALPQGSAVVEIGSHKGRSTTILGEAMRHRGRVYAIDPFVEGRLFGGEGTRTTFRKTLARAELEDVVEHIDDYSTHARVAWRRSFDLLYVDGKHDYWTCTDDLKWSRRLDEGSAVLVHDAYSSIGVTVSILATVLPSRSLAYESRVGSLATFRRRRPNGADRLRVLAEVPWWMRNVVIKVLLRLRLRRLARALGHTGPYDPY